jgi:hypothetical protein
MDEFDRGTDLLNRDLTRLRMEHHEEDVDRFVAALGAGLIRPEDF